MSLACGPLFAHPHSDTDQQVKLSLGLDRVGVEIIIVPSPAAAPFLVGRLDANGDGEITEAEAKTFGAAVLSSARLTLASEAIPLHLTDVLLAKPEELIAGVGGLSIKAEADLKIDTKTTFSLTFDIGFSDMSHDWFVQPYYYADLGKAFGSLEVERRNDANQITIGGSPASK